MQIAEQMKEIDRLMRVANLAPSKPGLFDAFELSLPVVWGSWLLIAVPRRRAVFGAGGRFGPLIARVGGLKLLVFAEVLVFTLVLFSERDQVVSGDGQRLRGLLQPSARILAISTALLSRRSRRSRRWSSSRALDGSLLSVGTITRQNLITTLVLFTFT